MSRTSMDEKSAAQQALLDDNDIESPQRSHDSVDSDLGLALDSFDKLEQGPILQREPPSPSQSRAKLIFWITTNVVSTVAITFINEAIFSDPALRHSQLLFASFHFLLTWLTLHIASSKFFHIFERRNNIRTLAILPLAASMALSVAFTNMALSHCSIPFFQTARVLLTPVVALLAFVCFRQSIPLPAALALIPVCLGAGTMAYFDVRRPPSTDSTSPAPGSSPPSHSPSSSASNPASTSAFSSATEPLGILLALISVLVSAVYTVWISHFHTKLSISSPQLLHRQSLLGAGLLLLASPWLDSFPASVASISATRWIMILASGVCACILNLSQFFIIGQAGPVVGAVVGHGKTVVIVSIGWFVAAQQQLEGMSVLGCLVAVGGISLYSAVMIVYR